MPQEIEVQLPDGSVGVFPEGTPTETIEQTLANQFPSDRSRRASGGQDQEPGVPSPQPEPEPDPLGDVVREIDGVALNDEERQAIAHARTLDDPKEKRLIAARLAARIDRRSNSGNFADQIQRSGVGAAMRGFTNMFGIGDLAAATGEALSSDLSFTDALELQQEMRRAGEEDYPIWSTGSEIAGAIITGGGAIKAASRVAPKIGSAFALQKGQKLANIGKVSGIGAAEGAITEGVTEDNAGTGALIGAAGGPAGLALAKTLGVALPVFARGLNAARGVTRPTMKQVEASGAKGLKILADKLGEPVEDLFQRFQQIKALTDKPPSIAELANKNAALELRKLLEQSPDATRVAQDLAETNLSTRAKEVGQNISFGGDKATKTGLTAARTKEADELFEKAHKDDIEITGEQADRLFQNPDFRDALRSGAKSLLREIDDLTTAAGKGEAITIKGKDLDDIRQLLRSKQGPGFSTRFGDLAAEVDDIGRAGSENFAKAMDAFEKASSRIEGQGVGSNVLANKNTSDFREQVKIAQKKAKKAVQAGARDTLDNMASENLGSAKNLVDSLSTESGIVTRLREIIPRKELDLIIDTAKAHRSNLDSLAEATPRTRGADAQDVLPSLVNAVVLASPTTSAASKVFSGGRLAKVFKRLVDGRVEDRVLNNMAKDIFDPDKTEAVISALRRTGVTDENILGALIGVGGGASAQQASDRRGE